MTTTFTATDHVAGFLFSVASAIAGGLLMPFLALAFVAASPWLVLFVALKGHLANEPEALAASPAARTAA